MTTSYNRAATDISPKVAAAGIAGAVTTIVMFLLHQFVGIELPEGVGAAITTVLAFAAGYLIPDNR